MSDLPQAEGSEEPRAIFRLQGVPTDYPGLQVALALVAENDGIPRCVGSAFAVYPGLAITAAHVAEDCVKFQEKRDRYKQSNPQIALTAYQLYEGKMFVWRVDQVYWSATFEIAFITFLRPSWWGDAPGQQKPKFARLNLNPPSVGDTVRIFGFPQSRIENGILNVYPAECLSPVAKVDVRTEEPKWYRPLAHIEVEGEIEHGMSGGPCFDKDWNVIGVNSAGWTGMPGARVALLWPAMKIEIDLFKSGLFPAIDLFKSGETKALGYRRVQVTPSSVRFGRVDPDSMKRLGYIGTEESLSRAIDFAGAEAQQALAELRDSMTKAYEGTEELSANKIIRLARHYFWELESALRLSIVLASIQAKLDVPDWPTWEQLVSAWRSHNPESAVLDEIATLDFDWNGIDLFELRGYADLAKSGVFYVQQSIPVDSNGARRGPTLFATLDPPCRQGGSQLFLADGLDRFLESARRFVQRLLLISRAQTKS